MASLSVVAIFAALLFCAGPTQAQSLEAAIMPGEVSRAHIKEESDCKQCHLRMQRSAQPRLCLDCHKKVAQDVRTRSGYHGRQEERECRNCHTEHKGRDGRIVKLDEKTFDHTQTDFALFAKHRQTQCASCHKPNTKHRDAPSNCSDCHRKDDRHKDTLGSKCESCHNENSWKQSSFEHAKTKFPLLLRHTKTKCNECHTDLLHFANTSRDCLSCHNKDDKHKSTLGPKCEQCHNEGGWKEARFEHGKTHFPLFLSHAKVKCSECHADLQHFANTPLKCYSCHRRNDVHQGVLGEKCENCHNEKAWQHALRFEHDRDTKFALRDAHRKPKCDSCHPDARAPRQPRINRLFADKPASSCIGCHARDDLEKGHKGRYGEKCQTCHAEKSFKAVFFDHARDTTYALRAKHLQVKCDTCHKGKLYGDKLQSRCAFCHQADDKHKGQLGSDCASCHAEVSWLASSFDHNKSEFPLREKHSGLECKKCHASPLFKDVKKECHSCHAKDDSHKQRLGPRCEQCHSTRDWKTWEFDHNLRSRYKLVEKHAKIKCLACHLKPIADKIFLPVDCNNCHHQDDIHFETNGTQCERCHLPDNWRHVINQENSKKSK